MAMKHFPFARWSNVRRDMLDACKKAKIADCSPNDLRRSVATLLRARGVEPSLIGAYLGHADSRMAERVYGRLAPEQLAHLLAVRLRDTVRTQRA
jgi:integrase